MNIHKLLNEIAGSEAKIKKKQEDGKFEELLKSLPEDQREQVRRQKAEADTRSDMTSMTSRIPNPESYEARVERGDVPSIGGESKERATIGRAMSVGNAMIDAERTGKLPVGTLPNQVKELLLTPETREQLNKHQMDMIRQAKEAGASPEELEVAAGPASTSQTLSKMGTAAYDLALSAAAMGGARGSQVKDMIVKGDAPPAIGSVISQKTTLPPSNLLQPSTTLTRTTYKPVSIKSKLLALSLSGMMGTSGLPPASTAPTALRPQTASVTVGTSPRTTTAPVAPPVAPRTTTAPVAPPTSPRPTTAPAARPLAPRPNMASVVPFAGFAIPTSTAPKIPTTPVTPKTTTATTEISPTSAKNIISTETPGKAKASTQDVIKTISKIDSVAPAVASVASVIPTAASVATVGTSIYNSLGSGRNTSGAGRNVGGLPPLKSGDSEESPYRPMERIQPTYKELSPVYVGIRSNLLKPKGESQQQGSVDRTDLAGYYSNLQFGARGTPRDPRIGGGAL